MAKKNNHIPTTAMPLQEKKWRAESDASVLAEAAAIKRDPSRMAAAKKAAKSLLPQREQRAKDMQAETKALRTLAKGKK